MAGEATRKRLWNVLRSIPVPGIGPHLAALSWLWWATWTASPRPKPSPPLPAWTSLSTTSQAVSPVDGASPNAATPCCATSSTSWPSH